MKPVSTSNCSEIRIGNTPCHCLRLPCWGNRKVPSIQDVTPQQFLGERICICGNFPTPESQQGFLIDGRPLTPEQTYPNVIVARLTNGIAPGTHNITGNYAAGFPRSHQVRILVLKSTASIAKSICGNGWEPQRGDHNNG